MIINIKTFLDNECCVKYKDFIFFKAGNYYYAEHKNFSASHNIHDDFLKSLSRLLAAKPEDFQIN